MVKNSLFVGFILFCIFSIVACEGFRKEQALSNDDSTEVDTLADYLFTPVISDFIPEVIVLLENVDKKYHPELLDSTINTQLYPNETKKALNLGVYSTDLMYACMNHDTTYNLAYVKAINQFAKDLCITEGEEKLLHFRQNPDSLLYDIITQLSHDRYHQYFTLGQDKVEHSFLVSTGAWIEFLHLSCQILRLSGYQNEELKKQIAEQKIYLANLSLYISFYDDNEIISSFRDDFDALLDIYDKVNITYEDQRATTEIVNNTVVTIQHDIVNVEISLAQLKLIEAEIEKIRSIIIAPDKSN